MSFIIIAKVGKAVFENACKPRYLKYYLFFKRNFFFMFLYYFDMLISKIIFNKIKKNYFDGFLNKKNIF
jgi:hypothetical protein